MEMRHSDYFIGKLQKKILRKLQKSLDHVPLIREISIRSIKLGENFLNLEKARILPMHSTALSKNYPVEIYFYF